MYHLIKIDRVEDYIVDWELYANKNIDNKVYATQRGLGKIVNRNEATIRNWRRIKEVHPITGVVNTTKGMREVSLYDQDEIYAAMAEYDPSSMEYFLKFLNDKEFEGVDSKLILANITGKIKDKKKMLEKEIELELAQNKACWTQIETLCGRIDVMTDDEIIEIKSIEQWKHAIGQVLVYCLDYPDKKPHIYLFGEVPKSYRDLIISKSTELGVKVSFREEQDFVNIS